MASKMEDIDAPVIIENARKISSLLRLRHGAILIEPLFAVAPRSERGVDL